MWARPAWRLAFLLVATLRCTQANPAYRVDLIDGSDSAERDGEPAPADGGVPDGGARPTDSGVPATDSSTAGGDAPVRPDLVVDAAAPADAAIPDAPQPLPDAPPADLPPAVVDAPTAPREAGLLGSYFDGTQLENGTPGCLDLQRVDRVIDFNWPVNVRPGPNMDHDNFSVRWTGELEPVLSGTYIFTARTDDGVRLYLNDQLVLGNWTASGLTTQTSPPTNLMARQRYTIRMEYRETTNAAVARLSWTPPGQNAHVIPEDVLIPAPRVPLPVKPGCRPTPL